MRHQHLARLLWAAFLLAPFTACVGDVGYPPGAPPGVPGNNGLGDVDVGCAWNAVLTQRCTGGACHDNDAPAAGLDLASAGVGARLLDRPSSVCAGQVLVVAGDPSQSYLLDKLSGTASCGAGMPLGVAGGLPAAEFNCLADWVAAVGSGGGGGGTVPPDGEDPPPGGGW